MNTIQQEFLLKNRHVIFLAVLPDGDLLCADEGYVTVSGVIKPYGPYVLMVDGKLQNIFYHYAICHEQDIPFSPMPPRPKRKVVIEIDGGVPSVESCPDDIDVVFHDYDISHCEECGSNDVVYICGHCDRTYCKEHYSLYCPHCSGAILKLPHICWGTECGNASTWECTGCGEKICDEHKHKSEPCKPDAKYVRLEA